jgi:hypothetical protein
MAKHASIFNDLATAEDLLTRDPYADGVRSPSPSVNFIFGNTHLIPFGTSVIFWGPPKGGKSLICNFMIGQLHKDYPDAIAIKFNSEMREKYQMTKQSMKLFGIDPKRYYPRDTNRPEEIFDYIEGPVVQACEKGHKIKLIVIDSITDIMGRRALNADTVMTQQMGDDAATVTAGLRRIRAILRKYDITLLMVAQERAVLDPVEIMRGKKTKMAGAFYLQHFAEYFVYVEPNQAAEGKVDLLKQKFELDSVKDIMGNAENVGHKIKVQMKDSSVGVAKRVGEFTFNKFMGIVNTHEEAFRLGVARNVMERPNNQTYILKNWPAEGQESRWRGREECLLSIKANNDLQQELVKRARQMDINLFQNGMTDEDFNAASSEAAVPDEEDAAEIL